MNRGGAKLGDLATSELDSTVDLKAIESGNDPTCRAHDGICGGEYQRRMTQIAVRSERGTSMARDVVSGGALLGGVPTGGEMDAVADVTRAEAVGGDNAQRVDDVSFDAAGQN